MKLKSLFVTLVVCMSMHDALAGRISSGGDEDISGAKWTCQSSDGKTNLSMQPSKDLTGPRLFIIHHYNENIPFDMTGMYLANARLVLENGQVTYLAQGQLMGLPDGTTDLQFKLKIDLSGRAGIYSGRINALDAKDREIELNLTCSASPTKQMN